MKSRLLFVATICVFFRSERELKTEKRPFQTFQSPPGIGLMVLRGMWLLDIYIFKQIHQDKSKSRSGQVTKITTNLSNKQIS